MKFSWRWCATLCFLLCAVKICRAQQRKGCPPQESILPCKCLLRGGAEFQIWCTHSDLPRVLEGLKAVGQYISQPIDELILENNNLPSLPGRAFMPLKVLRVMLRYNGIERVSGGWLAGQEKTLMELFVVEPELRALPAESLNHLQALEAVTIQTNTMKRLPNFSGLPKLRYLQIESFALLELPPENFKMLPSLERFHVSGSPMLTRLEAGLLQDLPRLLMVNISNCGISWMHLRAITRLPALSELSLMANNIRDVGMVGRAIRDLPNLSVVRLDYNAILEIGEAAFVDLPQLKKLTLANNKIGELQYGAFHRVPMLKSIDLNNNLLNRVHPESFLQNSGSGLEELWLVNNRISHVAELRSLLDALPRLIFLDMSYNQLEAIPFGALRGHPTLERLHLDHNRIHLIAREAFMAMPALRELRLKNNSLSDMLDAPLWNLPALKGLDLSQNYYRRINPSLLENLRSLRRLDLSNNEISVVEHVSFLGTPELEHVNLSSNAIAALHPATFRAVLNLYELDVSRNMFLEFPANLPRGLEYLHLSHNQINKIPRHPSPELNLPSLRMLDIAGNGIQFIPPGALLTLPKLRKLLLAKNALQNLEDHALDGLNSLEVLNLENNRLIQIGSNTFKDTKELAELNIRDNRLNILRAQIFQHTPRLRKLDISHNKLTEILPETFELTRELQLIDASHNSLINLPNSLYGLKKLRTLNLASNQLQNVNAEMLSSLTSLGDLRLSQNSLKELKMGAFNNLQYLKVLHLDNNALETIESNAIRSLPLLKAVKLSENKLVELPNFAFNNLPALQVIELQENRLKIIANKAFHMVPHLLMLNLSQNQLPGFEEAGLRWMRSLEMIDLSGNKIVRVSKSSLEKMEWLVELKLDNNIICAVHGNPFDGMPRLRVLSMRNNKMMSFPENAMQKMRGNIAVFDLDGNPLACTCSLLWMREWLHETSNVGPNCVDGTLVRDMRLSRQQCTKDDLLAEPVAPGCEAELLSAPGLFGTSQVFSQLTNLRNNSKPKATEKNHLAPSPEESDYFYDEYIDYPYNESALTGPEVTTKSPHYVPGDTPTIYAAAKNRTKTPDKPKEVINSPSSSGFTFFGVPLPSINLNSLLGGSGRKEDKQPPPAQRKTAIMNTQSHSTGRVFPPSIPKIETGGFVPLIPGSGGFKPIINTVVNDSVVVEKATVTEITTIASVEKTTNVVTNGHPVPTPTPVAFSTTVLSALETHSDGRTQTAEPSAGENSSKLETFEEMPAKVEQINKTLDAPIEIAPKLKNYEVNTTKLELQSYANSQKYEHIVHQTFDNTTEPTVTNQMNPIVEETDLTTSSSNTVEQTTEQPKRSNVATPLTSLLVPGGQQPHFRSPGRPTITKVMSPHGSAPLQSSMQVAEENMPSYYKEEIITEGSMMSDTNGEQDTSWYFMNYNNTNLSPYVGGGGSKIGGGDRYLVICVLLMVVNVHLQ